MAHYQAYQCPECLGTFRFLHHPDDEPPPSFCPRCGASMEDDSEVFVPAVPHIGKTIGRSGDQVYRAMEDSSAANAEAVSAITGEDASNMKITNMADYLRPGDQAAKMSTSAVALNKGQGGFSPLMGQTGAQFAAATGNGAFPHTGELTRRFLSEGHVDRARQVQRNGEMGRHKK